MYVSVGAEEVGLYVAVEEVWSIRTKAARTKQRRVAFVVVFNMFDLIGDSKGGGGVFRESNIEGEERRVCFKEN